MYSADNGHGQVVRLLLEAGANPDLVSSHGYTAADLASINGHDQIQVKIRLIYSFYSIQKQYKIVYCISSL